MSRFRNFLRFVFGSEQGHNILLYLFFVVISFIFWMLMTLNNEVEKDYRVIVNVNDLPDSVTFVNDYPSVIRVKVKDKESAFLQYMFGSQPSLNLKWKNYIDGEGNFAVSEADMRSQVLNVFGAGVNIVSITPDSFACRYTTSPGKKVPVVIDATVEPNLQYVQSGAPSSDVDSVRVYSDKETLEKISSVYTYHFELKDITDTIYREVKIAPIAGVKTVPGSVTVMVPVEQLITKTAVIPIVSRGVPYGMNIVTFPSRVKVSYLVPLSQYKKEQDFRAEVYFDETTKNVSKLRLYLNQINWAYGDIIMAQDSVDYIIEKH